MMKRAGKLYPRVILASPGRQPPRVRHSASSSGPAARWIAPSTPPPPSSVVFAAFTIASASIDHFALARRPRAELATDRPGMKISLRFLMRRFFRSPANPNLSIQFNPIKCQRSVRIDFELHSLFAFVIREKNETVLVESFQQHHAHGRFCVASSGSETHRVDVANLGLNCRSEPV